jgi:lipopolysaccharide transport system permease protein
VFSSLVKNRLLLIEMTRRDVTDRYAGNILGSAWAVVHPLAMILIFVFIFSVVFRVKAQIIGGVPADHTAYMIGGLIPWLVAADILSRGPGIITSHAALVKQVVFPIEVLPVKVVLASLPTLVIGTLGLLGYMFFTYGTLSPAFLLYPVAALILYIFLIGAAFALSAAGVFLRDIKDFIQLFVMVGLYAAPIFYYMDWLPEAARPFIYLNPFTTFIECFHDAAYYGGIRDYGLWAGGLGWSIASLLTGVVLFHRSKHQFGSFI